MPSIYNPLASNLLGAERTERVQRRDNKKIAAALLERHDSSNDENDSSVANAHLDELSNAYKENITKEVQTESSDPMAQSDECLTDAVSEHYVEEIESLKKEIEDLRRENTVFRKTEKKQRHDIAALKISAINIQKKHDFEIQLLQKRLSQAEYEVKNIEEKLLTIFTKGQITKLKNGIHRPTWSEDDIAQSITLCAASAKAYKLLYRKGFPLPAIRTLQDWAQKIDVRRGLIQPVLKILSAATSMEDAQKICVLSFDEMKIRKSYCYDRTTDSTLTPASYVQVAMIRGLMSSWKQPIFYDFDCKMTTEILHNILRAAKDCGYNIVAVTCDLGGTNRSLFNALNVNEEKPWFSLDERKVFVFADVPHLLKLLRNHFLDSGYLIDGKIVSKDVIVELMALTNADLSITHKISVAHLNISGAQRQNVKMAAKLFSHTIAKAITRAASLGHLNEYNWQECYHLFKTTNDWFDVMNVKVPHSDSRERMHGYGLNINVQNTILHEMTELVKNMRAVGKYSLLPFQKGIIQSSNALMMLFAYIQEHFGLKYILTYRLNQDVLENFFGVIRSKGGLHDHPDQQEFKYRLRNYILGRNEGVISNRANVEADNTPDIEILQPPLTGVILKTISASKNISQCEYVLDDTGDLEHDGIENVAGYICHKLRNQLPEISLGIDDCYSWVNHVSEGGFSKPTAGLTQAVCELEKVFKAINGDGLLITNNFVQNHIEQASHIDCHIKIKKLFFRARMFFKIRKLNKEIEENDHKKKRKLCNILT